MVTISISSQLHRQTANSKSVNILHKQCSGCYLGIFVAVTIWPVSETNLAVVSLKYALVTFDQSLVYLAVVNWLVYEGSNQERCSVYMTRTKNRLYRSAEILSPLL